MRKYLMKIGLKLPSQLRVSLKRMFPNLAQWVIQNPNTFLGPKDPTQFGISEAVLKALIFHSTATHPNPLKPSLALFSPWKPSKSGIAWHADKLVAELRKTYEVDVFVSNVSNSWIPEVGVYPFAFFEVLNYTKKYQYRMFNFGNGPDHEESLRALEEVGGTVILHDVRISSIPTLWPVPNNWRIGKFGDLGLMRIPLDSQIFVHSNFARKMIESDPYGKYLSVDVFENGLPIDNIGSTRNGPIKVIGSAGFVTPSKSPELIAEAWGRIAKINSDIQFRFIGQCAEKYRQELLQIFHRASHGKANLAFFQDLDEKEYWKQIDELDLAVQLRNSTNGESSGTAIEIQARGIPTVCTDIGANLELPDNIFTKVAKNITASQLADVILELVNNNSDYILRSKNGISWSKQRTFSNYASEIMKKIKVAPIRMEDEV